MNFDINEFKSIQQKADRYAQQLYRLKQRDWKTTCIEQTVAQAIKNINNRINSFIIYGEPQSGKTEMMIVLTAKLLDNGHKIIIVLLNDNVGLLEQNLKRFAYSELDPAPKNYKQIMDDVYQMSNQEWIIFCKKNQSDLQSLIRKLKDFPNKVVIDDEADYASPNGKVNREAQT